MAKINPLVVDLSHHDPADDYDAVKRDGIVGVIYKASEGQTYTDPTYVQQQRAAKSAGLLFGSYHFADASNVHGQIDNYLRFACPDGDELFCLDWEDNPTGNGMMSLADVKTWIEEVERALNRPGECVVYSGNTAKDQLGDTVDTFLGSHRLWLAQYSSTPSWQKSWDSYFLWQFTDGEYGAMPHSIDGVGPCDINSYDDGTPEQLRAEWATGAVRPPTPEPAPDQPVINVLINAPPGVIVKTRVFQFGNPVLRDRKREAGVETEIED